MTPLTWSMKHYQGLNTTDEKSSVVTLVNSEELECMSKNIYFEAAVESTAGKLAVAQVCLLYTSPSPRDRTRSRMPSSA